MNRPFKQKINKNIVAMNYTIDQMDFIDIYRTFHPKEKKIHSFQMYMEHGRTQNKPQKFKKIEIISSIFSDNKRLKQQTTLKEKTQNTEVHGE